MDPEELGEKLTKFTSDQVEQTIQYNNVIIAVGYIGVFTLWGLIKEYILPFAQLWSALLILISIAFFVSWEIVKMIRIQNIRKPLHVILMNGNYNSLPEEIEKYSLQEQRYNLISNKIYPYFLIPTLITGCLSAIILLYAFIYHLITGPLLK